MVIHKNHLYASFGERGLGMIAQDPSKHPGSIIRINIDGSIPEDNPSKINKNKWLPEIFLIGVRNPQGMAISPKNKKVLFFSAWSTWRRQYWYCKKRRELWMERYCMGWNRILWRKNWQ